ncbi:class I SAM-dependent DNA methyltransferase [Rhizobium lusitanum]|uniref:HsdM family class I SAM-dependent methyltransferase n=1 Tax=Rhizobium lusitanum TaxID=293958 RepID=UPI00195E6BD9|nr:N-6 DNA methylase [Rhizobium lusitanum]MBM7045526.1 N-6 DNA methylase [Rhizobium lusitanum]
MMTPTQTATSNGGALWLGDLTKDGVRRAVSGLVLADGFDPNNRDPEEVAIIEKARDFSAHSVFFEAGRNGRPGHAQAFVFVDDERTDQQFAELHQRLWSWGGVPLVYRKTAGLIQLFRCAHNSDFLDKNGKLVCNPVKTLELAARIEEDAAWWDATRIRNGTIWDDPEVCREMLSSTRAAHRRLIAAVDVLYRTLISEKVLNEGLSRRLLILSLLIAYLEERKVLSTDYFGQFVDGATKFFEVLADGPALIRLLQSMEDRFNGHVFRLNDEEKAMLRGTDQLRRFADLVEAQKEAGGQLTLWKTYSFGDLPVELISHIYQLFVKDNNSSVYTPPALVRLVLEEALSWKRLDQLEAEKQVILDPACGSGIFLVEAYKRLILHWRSRNNWAHPSVRVLKTLIRRVHGVDMEAGAIQLAGFSLCLALCDALESEEIKASVKLFPILANRSLHHDCFFNAVQTCRRLRHIRVGVVVGNPPFESKLTTPGAEKAFAAYQKEFDGALPDKQLGYLFLHEAMKIVAAGGALCMLQQDGFLYNQGSAKFRRTFFKSWRVREVLDFVSVRGLFEAADTKVIVVVAAAEAPKENSRILHAVFRRTGRANAGQGFDIDYYDLHWVPNTVALNADDIWPANIVGGGRTFAFLERLKEYPTLKEYAEAQEWTFGDGYIEGDRGVSRDATHLIGENMFPSSAFITDQIDPDKFRVIEQRDFEGPRTAENFSPPMLLVRKHIGLQHAVWEDSFLAFKNEIVGFAGKKGDAPKLKAVDRWITENRKALQAFVALSSSRLFKKKATAIGASDIRALPYMENGALEISANEAIIAADIVDYQSDLVRLGDDSAALKKTAEKALDDFANVYCSQINVVYGQDALVPLTAYVWPGVVCQPFSFGGGASVDWSGAEKLRGRVDRLLKEQRGSSINVTRIARIYDDRFIFFIKPNRLRYWLRSVALRDADETLSDLRLQGY